MEWLTDTELLIISLVYGINHLGLTLSQVDVATALGTTPEFVQRKLRQALDKLNDPSKKTYYQELATTYIVPTNGV